jgi:hypothetical protein
MQCSGLIISAAFLLATRNGPPRGPGTGGRKVLVGSGSSAIDMQTAEEPKNEKNNQYQAQSAADPRPTVPTVPVIATAAAEQQDD